MLVMLRNDTEYTRFIYNETTEPDVLFESDIRHPILKRLCGIHRSIKLNRVFPLPFKSIWYPYYLDYGQLKEQETHIFIFMEGNPLSIDHRYLSWLRKRFPMSKLVFRLTNSIRNYNEWLLKWIEGQYDLIVSMDRADCDRYGWLYVPNTFPRRLPVSDSAVSPEFASDVFFVGFDKGRHGQLVQIYDALVQQGLAPKFFISRTNPTERVQRSGIYYVDHIPYQETLSFVAGTKCLLELVRDNQRGYTLRAVEGAVFHKRLITNNRAIRDEAIYDPGCIRIIQSAEDIDGSFITCGDAVEYPNMNTIWNSYLFHAIQNAFNAEE